MRALLFLLCLCACSSDEAMSAAPVSTVKIDRVQPPMGVRDSGRDPAVVGVTFDGSLCAGTLIAKDIVITSRRCTGSCEAPPDPAPLRVIDVEQTLLLARARAVIEDGCDTDVALLVLDRDVEGIDPLYVRSHGAAQGDFVRTVGFGRDREGAVTRLVREHVAVSSAGPLEMTVVEAACRGEAGGPALDEGNGKIVGVLSRCADTEHNVYVRTDALLPLIDRAFAWQPADGPERKGRRREGRGKRPPSDIGGACESAFDCAAGVCVTDGAHRYCSRPCALKDKCPTGLKCTAVGDGPMVCIQRG
jgi:hypothetical protein